MSARPTVRPYEAGDRPWAERFLAAELGGHLQARRGELVDVAALAGFVAQLAGEPAGLLTYRVDDEGCEVASLAASPRGRGVDSALLAALRAEVPGARPWVVTTNDNLGALRFYQRRGFALVSLRPGAVDEARRTLKPSIPRVGELGIPLRDELELRLTV